MQSHFPTLDEVHDYSEDDRRDDELARGTGPSREENRRRLDAAFEAQDEAEALGRRLNW